jgi:protein-tyrosine phosphatase
MPSPLNPDDMPTIDGIDSPGDLYLVLKEPALLAGMRFPRRTTPWKGLGAAGFSGIVCLADDRAYYNPFPLRLLHARKLEDLHHGSMPINPAMQEKLVREATGIVVNGLNRGEGIIVHCAGGTGRTGTVIGCVLREFGVPADTVIDYLDQVNKARGNKGWPEARWQAEMVRKY